MMSGGRPFTPGSWGASPRPVKPVPRLVRRAHAFLSYRSSQASSVA